jgi:uncharacterized RDD family membrane protein YckC
MGSQPPYQPLGQPVGWDQPGQQLWQTATGASYGPPQPPAAPVLASFWRRFAAYLIDWLVVAVVGGVLYVLGIQPSLLRLIQLLFNLAYFAYFWSQHGQTPGMMALGIRVIQYDGDKLGFGRTLLRWTVLFLLGVTLLIPLISVFMVAFGQRKQGLHDLAAGSVVVRRS